MPQQSISNWSISSDTGPAAVHLRHWSWFRCHRGLGRTDAEFIESARKIFGRSLTVVVKATDSTVDAEDLSQVAEQVERHLGRAPIVLENGEPSRIWRAGKTAVLDAEIDRLMVTAKTDADQTGTRD
jgi:hypothetical protein